MKDTFSIGSSRLNLQVVRPGSGIYDRTRFNWSCFVNRITLDGEIEFAEPEQRDPNQVSSYGAGICSEYQQPEAIEAARIGEEYPRLGNGYLMKTDKPFNFMFTEPCRPFPRIWDVKPDSVSFVTDMPLCQGFAGREEKTVKVVDNTVSITTRLSNYGKRDIVAQEYNHNFMSLNKAPISPDYRLYVPGFAGLETGKFAGEGLYGNDAEGYLALREMPKSFYMTFLDTVKEGFAPFSYRLALKDKTISVTETDSFVPSHAVVWGVGHCMCAEIFVAVNVKPGETQEWTRTWTFEK